MFGNKVADALQVMRRERVEYKDFVPQKALVVGRAIVPAMQGQHQEVVAAIAEMVKKEIPLEYPHAAVWWYSVLMGMQKNANTFFDFIAYVRKNRKVFSLNTQYFLFYQLKSLGFLYAALDSKNAQIELWKLFKEIVEEFSDKLKMPLEQIPMEERNENLILVITEQFLDVQHGPTKTALDRCKAIIKRLKKEVILINTAELLSSVGEIPFFEAKAGTYASEKGMKREQIWEGVRIPYIQCLNNMPNMETLEKFLNRIYVMKPKRIVAIGGGGMLSNLANKIVPVLSVELVPSNLGYTSVQYQTLGRKLNEYDLDILKSVGYTERHVIGGIFTSGILPQTVSLTREKLGVPADKFLIIVVGARLDMEVTGEFLEMLEHVITSDMWVGFLGNFQHYQNRIARFPKLKVQSVAWGMVNDVLPFMEVSNLYVNPIRKGGGTSCVEAMSKGIPVVTAAYGDVSVNAGQEFWVTDYSEMQKKILQYYSDKKYYEAMSTKAKKRTEILLDTETEFVRILAEVDKREAEDDRTE